MNAWRDLARGARAADQLLATIAPGRVAKAADPLTRDGFDDTVRAIALALLSAVEGPEERAATELQDALDVNWPRLSASDRERAIRQAQVLIGRLASQVVPPVRSVLREQGRAVVDAVRGAAIGRYELPIAAVWGQQDARIVEHAVTSQALFVTDQYGKRAAAFAEVARAIVARGLEQGLDRYAIGEDLRKALGSSLGRSQSYYPKVASIFAARARTWSLLSSFEDAGIQRFEVSAVLDEATCFAAGTRILMAGGAQMPIQNVRAGMEVMSCCGRPRRVRAVLRQPARKWGEFVFDGQVGPLVLTQSHGLLTARGWMRAHAITLEDKVAVHRADGPGAAAKIWGDERSWGMRRGRHDPRTLPVAPWPHPMLEQIGAFAKVRSIAWTETGRTEDAYDIEVEEDMGYVAEGLLVHNSQICRYLDGKIFTVGPAAQRYRDVAASEDPEAVKQLQPFVRERRGDDGTSVLYVGEAEAPALEIARVTRSAVGTRDDRGEFSGGASAAQLAAAGIAAPPYHPHCRSELVPA